MKLLLIFFLFLKGHYTFADEFPNLFGCFCEGGLITGVAGKNDKILIDGVEIKTFENGEFIFAFGRKYKDTIKVEFNDKLKIFNIKKKKYKIERINGLPKKKVEPSKEDFKRIIKDKEKISLSKKVGEKKKLFDKKFILPVNGRLSGVFGSQRILNSKPRRPHYGIDFHAPEGTPVKSMMSGIVTMVEKDMYFTGGTIIFDHGHGISTLYMHMKDINVKKGQKVKKGEIVGTLGQSGRATGPHLDIRLNWFEIKLDPATILN